MYISTQHMRLQLRREKEIENRAISLLTRFQIECCSTNICNRQFPIFYTPLSVNHFNSFAHSFARPASHNCIPIEWQQPSNTATDYSCRCRCCRFAGCCMCASVHFANFFLFVGVAVFLHFLIPISVNA